MVIPTAAVLGAIQAVGPAILGATAQTLLTKRERFPSLAPGELLQASLQIQALSERGLVPRVSTDPFTGNLVISTESQSEGLFNLLGERFAREALASTPEESAAIFSEREAFIESRRLNPVFPSGADPPVPTVREQVVASLSRSSPQPIAPGVVSNARPNVMVRRLAGPCAGPTTGFARLNCARGGIS